MEVTGGSPEFNKKTGIIILIDELCGSVANALGIVKWVCNPGIPSLKLTVAPENRPLEKEIPEAIIFRGELLVYQRVILV